MIFFMGSRSFFNNYFDDFAVIAWSAWRGVCPPLNKC